MLPYRAVYDEEHQQFRESVRRFAAAKIAPDFQRWEAASIIDRIPDLKSDLAVGWAYVDQCLREHINQELTTYAASTAKLWIVRWHEFVGQR
jgi:hypothetical protein